VISCPVAPSPETAPRRLAQCSHRTAMDQDAAPRRVSDATRPLAEARRPDSMRYRVLFVRNYGAMSPCPDVAESILCHTNSA
jgi:hypothetical protein